MSCALGGDKGGKGKLGRQAGCHRDALPGWWPPADTNFRVCLSQRSASPEVSPDASGLTQQAGI